MQSSDHISLPSWLLAYGSHRPLLAARVSGHGPFTHASLAARSDGSCSDSNPRGLGTTDSPDEGLGLRGRRRAQVLGQGGTTASVGLQHVAAASESVVCAHQAPVNLFRSGIDADRLLVLVRRLFIVGPL